MAKSPKGNSDAPRFKSSLPTGAERFLATIVVRALDDNWRTPEDFMRHFPPQVLMQSLASGGLAARRAVDPGRRRARAHRAQEVDLERRRRSPDRARRRHHGTVDDPRAFAAGRARPVPDPKLLWKFVTEDEFWKAYGAEAERVGRAALAVPGRNRARPESDHDPGRHRRPELRGDLLAPERGRPPAHRQTRARKRALGPAARRVELARSGLAVAAPGNDPARAQLGKADPGEDRAPRGHSVGSSDSRPP